MWLAFAIVAVIFGAAAAGGAASRKKTRARAQLAAGAGDGGAALATATTAMNLRTVLLRNRPTDVMRVDRNIPDGGRGLPMWIEAGSLIVEDEAAPFAFERAALWSFLPGENRSTYRLPAYRAEVKEPDRPRSENVAYDFIGGGQNWRKWRSTARHNATIAAYIYKACKSGKSFLDDGSKWSPSAALYAQRSGELCAEWAREFVRPASDRALPIGLRLWLRALLIELQAASAALVAFHHVTELSFLFRNVGTWPSIEWRSDLRDLSHDTRVNATAAWFAGAIKDARVFADPNTGRAIGDKLVSDDIPVLDAMAQDAAEIVWTVGASAFDAVYREIVDELQAQALKLASDLGVAGISSAIPVPVIQAIIIVAEGFYAAAKHIAGEDTPQVPWDRTPEMRWRRKHLDQYMHMTYQCVLLARGRIAHPR